MNNLAWLLASKPDPTPRELDRALELGQTAKEVLPGNPAVADTLGYVMLKREIQGAAQSYFREAISVYPPDSPGRALARCHLAMSYEANGEIEKAINEFQASLAEFAAFPGREECASHLTRLSGEPAAASY